MEVLAKLINLPVLISSLVGFIIFYWVLCKTLWKPVLGVIDERKESIEAAFQEVDDARRDVAGMKADYEARLSEINAEAQAKLQEAIDKGQQVAAEIRAAAEDSREKLLAKTQEDIEREKQKAIAELRNQAIDLSFNITERAMKQKLDREAHEALVKSFISDLKELN